jgi:cytosine/adenosine deaminase-related metal-dependent hydrolase
VPTYRAAWILPIVAPPIRGGWVSVENGLIAGVGGANAPRGSVDLGDVAVLPALVNAHTHLELSYLRGRVGRANSFLDWIRTVVSVRREYPDPHDRRILDAARSAIIEAQVSGTGLFGDVSNTLVTAELLQETGMAARLFYELLAFNATDPYALVAAACAAADAAHRAAPAVHVSLAPHAPYSVSPAMFAAIRAHLDAHAGDVSSVHLAESPEEVEFLKTGGGGWRDLLQELGVWSDSWQTPRRSPVRYLAEMGFLDAGVLVVHAVQCSDDDLARLAALGTTVVSCPRSNRYVGVGDPPLAAFYAAGLPVAFGTDSLASVDDLQMFRELAAARRLAPRVRAHDLLESATLTGARALGFGHEFGSVEPGKRAALIAVRLPEDEDDVEEYLLSGIEPHAITWLAAATPDSR